MSPCAEQTYIDRAGTCPQRKRSLVAMCGTQKERLEGVPSIKQVLISLRDPNGVDVRPSGFDCVRPCHSERSGAESNCEAAPSKAKVESRADSAQDDTQGATPSEKITKGVRAFCSYSFSHALLARYSVLHLFGVLSGGNEPNIVYTFFGCCTSYYNIPSSLPEGAFFVHL